MMRKAEPFRRKTPLRRVDTSQFFKKDFEPAPLWVWPLAVALLGVLFGAIYFAVLVFGLPGFL